MTGETKQVCDQGRQREERKIMLTVMATFHAERDGFLLFSPSVVSYTDTIQDEQSN